MEMETQRGLGSVEETGIGQRMLRVFHAPRSVFEALADGGNWPDWVLPVAVVALFWAAHNLSTLSIVAPEAPTAMEGWEQMSEDQRALASRGLEMWRLHGWFSLPLISSFTSLALVSLVLLGIGRWVLRVDVNLRQTLAVKSYASLVTVPQWILLTPLARVGATASPQSFSPASLLSAEAASGPLGRFLAGLTVFDLWQVWVLGVGLAVTTGAPPRRAVGAVITLWLAWLALGALAPTQSAPTSP